MKLSHITRLQKGRTQMKRIISLFLAVSSFLTLLCSTAGAESSTGFADVPQTAWYYSYVMQMQKNGYMNGVSADQFDPDGHLTRAMVTTVLYRMEGSPSVSAPSRFIDVPQGTWYSDAIAWAENSGVVNGMDDMHFAPEREITREQLVTMIYRYAMQKGLPQGEASLEKFDDAANVSDYAKHAFAWACNAGIICGSKATKNLYENYYQIYQTDIWKENKITYSNDTQFYALIDFDGDGICELVSTQADWGGFEYYGFYLNAIQSNTAESYGCIANMRGPLLYSNGRGEVYCASGNYGGYSLVRIYGVEGDRPGEKALRRETIMDFIPNWDESDASDKLMKFDQEMHQYLDDRNCVQVKYYPLDTLLASNYYPVTVDVLEPSGLATRAQLAKIISVYLGLTD